MGRRCGPALCTLWRSTRYWIVLIRRSGNSTAASMQSSRYRHKWSYDRRLSSAVVLYGLEMESEELKFLRDQGMFYVYDFGVSPNQLTALDKHWQVTTVSRHVSPPRGEPGHVSPAACEPGHVSPSSGTAQGTATRPGPAQPLRPAGRRGTVDTWH